MLEVLFLKKAFFSPSLLKQNRFLVMTWNYCFLILSFNYLTSNVSELALKILNSSRDELHFCVRQEG